MSEFENRCPDCGVDVARVTSCRVCRGYCCPCVHAEARHAATAARESALAGEGDVGVRGQAGSDGERGAA